MINKKSKDKKLTEGQLKVLSQLAYYNKEESPLTHMRYIRTAFASREYYQLVHKVLYSNTLKLDTKLLDAILNISTPRRNHIGVKSIITYNFDDLVEQKLKKKDIDYNTVYREADMPIINGLNIYHVHGYLPHDIDEDIDDDRNLIFSEEDYHKVYRDAYCWSNITQLNAFRDSTCLFIGCSLTDPNLRRLLDVASRSGESPRHYAILKKIELVFEPNMKKSEKNLIDIYRNIDDNIRESFFKSLGLNIIWVDSYDEIPDILTSMV